MVSDLQIDAILESAVAGIPRVARALAAIPTEDWEKALSAAEQSYLHTARELSYSDDETQGWVATLIFRLRARAEREMRLRVVDGTGSAGGSH